MECMGVLNIMVVGQFSVRDVVVIVMWSDEFIM